MKQTPRPAWFSESVYELLHRRAGGAALLDFHLPDTVIFRNSAVCGYYFTSLRSPVVLRRNSSNFDIQYIYTQFTRNVHPLECCAMLVYVDLNGHSQIAFKTQYATPPQLAAVLRNLQKMDLTCVLQRVIWRLPGLLQPRAHAEGGAAERSLKAAREAKYTLQQQQQNLTPVLLKGVENLDHPLIISQYYHVIKVEWRPGAISLVGRRCCTPASDYGAAADVRCATFFGDHSLSEQFALSPASAELINSRISAFAGHIYGINGQQLTYLCAYVQLHQTSVERFKAANQQLTFLFAAALHLDGADNDEQRSRQLLFSVRQRFRQPFFLDYKTCRRVVMAFTHRALLKSSDQSFKTVYKLAMKSQSTYKLERNNVFELFNWVQQDLLCEMDDKHQRAYQFLQEVIQQLEDSTEYMALRQELESNDRPKQKCSRCQQMNATFKIPLKFLLAEPIFYFRSKIPEIVDRFGELSLADCYAAVNAVIFNNEQYLQFKDNMMLCLEDQPLPNTDDLEDDHEMFSQEDTPLLRVLLNDTLSNNLPATRKFFQQISKIRQERQRNHLDMQNLLNFYDVSPDSQQTLASIVPNKLLRRAGIVKTGMGEKCFMNRLSDGRWVRSELMICNQCYQEVIQAFKSMCRTEQQ